MYNAIQCTIQYNTKHNKIIHTHRETLRQAHIQRQTDIKRQRQTDTQIQTYRHKET
jgi:hypothetical protein